jgi:hypothetical protein
MPGNADERGELTVNIIHNKIQGDSMEVASDRIFSFLRTLLVAQL